jgi:hypothetical protein
MVSETLPSLRWGERAQAHGVTKGHSLGRREWGDPMGVANGDSGSEEGVIVSSHIA